MEVSNQAMDLGATRLPRLQALSTLIEESPRRVEEGAQQSDQTSNALSQIVRAVGQGIVSVLEGQTQRTFREFSAILLAGNHTPTDLAAGEYDGHLGRPMASPWELYWLRPDAPWLDATCRLLGVDRNRSSRAWNSRG